MVPFESLGMVDM